jgi:hypothetical protein
VREWLAAVLPEDLPRLSVGVSLLPGEVELSQPPSRDAHVIDVPQTTPLLLTLRWAGIAEPQQVSLEPGEIWTRQVGAGPLELQTAFESYVLRPTVPDQERNHQDQVLGPGAREGMLDEGFLRRLRELYPTPIAQAARRFQAASEEARRLAEAHNLVHALILTLGTISLAWCHYRELRPDGVQHWYDKFQRSAPTLGDWLGAARAGAKLASEIGSPLSGLETVLGGDGQQELSTALDELIRLRSRYAHSPGTPAAGLGEVERHLRAALDVCDFLTDTKFVIVEGNEPQRSGGFRVTVRAVAGDNPIFLPAPAFLYPQALYSKTLYLLQEPGDHLELAPFWVAKEGENGWELFFLNKRVDRGRGFEYVNLSKPDDSFVNDELPKLFSWFGDLRRSARRFKRADMPESLLHPRDTELPSDRIDLAGLHQQTKRSMLEALSVDQTTGERGWNHHLGLPPITPVGTAFGLRILRLVESSPSLFHSDEILDTLWRHRTRDGCWRSQSQLPTGRPEATASVLLALADHKDWTRARAVREPFERLLEPGRDPALWTYVSSMALVLPALSTIAPDSDLLEVLVRALDEAAVRDGRGRILYWTRLSRPAGHDAEPSPAHTARVLLAMQHCRAATERRLGAPPEELEASVQWLLAQPRWDNLYEEVRRPISTRDAEVLTVRHYTSAWVVRALLEYGVNSTHKRIQSTIRDVYMGHELGLWDWVAPDGQRIRRPGWATLDALRALQSFTLRAGF